MDNGDSGSPQPLPENQALLLEVEGMDAEKTMLKCILPSPLYTHPNAEPPLGSGPRFPKPELSNLLKELTSTNSCGTQ